MQIACPACHARYSVPDTAIGARGRTVRCAKCRHSWYQPGSEEDAGATAPPAEAARPAAAPAPSEPVGAEPASAGAGADTPRGWEDVGGTHAADHVATAEPVEAEPVAETEFYSGPGEEVVEPEPVEEPEVVAEPAASMRPTGSAFAEPEPEPVDAEYEDLDKPRGKAMRLVLICLVLLVLAAAAIYGAVRYFGAPDWLPVGQTTFAPASEALVLDFPADEQDRRELPNGRQLFAANGTITNTGDRTEHVPPVLVVLRDSQERIVYSWEMEPSRTELGPGESVKVSRMVTDVPRSAQMVDIGWKPS